MSLRSSLSPLRLACSAALVLFTLSALSIPSPAQPETQTPIYVTARVFQARAKKGSQLDLSDQVFRLRTDGLTDYEKWVTGLKKAYPQVEIELLSTHALRVFKSPRPAIVYFGNKRERNLELVVNAAGSYGDGTTPGVTLVPQVEYHFGINDKSKPISLAIQAFEAEDGMTYFFTGKPLQIDPQSYVTFIRPGAPRKAFEGEDIFLLFAVSVELKEVPAAARVLDEQQSAAFQARATKKVQPDWPAGLQPAGLGGKVEVRVEVSPDGRVAKANVFNSSLPEANSQVIAAVRQWEFPKHLFAEDKKPVSGLLTFNFNSRQ